MKVQRMKAYFYFRRSILKLDYEGGRGRGREEKRKTKKGEEGARKISEKKTRKEKKSDKS